MNALTRSIIPENETQRMAAVRRYDILDTPPDGAFDRVTAIAARRFDAPIAIISIVDHDRIWFKSRHGLSVEQIDREPGLCASAILSPDPHILADASVDPRSLTNPLVAGDFGLRFYAGVPLTTSDGFNLGTLCVIDKTPRSIDDAQVEDLKDLASVVMDQMELRLSARQAVARAEILAREIDHRVMNSLQFVSSMLTLQSRENHLADATAEQLKIAANRVGAVARVHRHFQSDEAAESTSCITFLRRMCADLSDIVGKTVAVGGDEGEVATTRIQPIGLIVNELVTNAAKHGDGRIDVSFRIMSETHEISVCDEGSGLPSCYDPTFGGGLGTKVVAVLASQLGGRIVAGRSPSGSGSCVTVTFPA
ncbi:sensor histidine kinase [Aquibium oceanicum]|uniref:sensor histidine kinase n=1 Tax=Aquibium oceanicum TaxID=1670800 RepID=UPI0012FF893B|nr:histidine kinase dimerization/phosphoacceptor domain -containing protein [Aquibium oceanicum]